jgi:cob(I)alamin adenosyltransferase
MSSELVFKELIDFLHHVQSAIFDLGSNLACEVENRSAYKLPQISNEFIRNLEEEIDRLDSELSPLKNFILPGGSLAASSFHLCRTNARTVERKLIAYLNETKEELPANSIVFLNRISDYFFVLARYVNKVQKTAEIEWKPRK